MTTKRSNEAIADKLEAMVKKPQYYPRSPAVLMAAAAALRAPTITVTDAMAIRGKMASRDVYVGISDVRRIIEAALQVRSEE